MNATPHIPETLPLGGLDWKRLIPNNSRAMHALGRYDGMLAGMVNAAVLLSPVTSQEAVLSSRIEGTRASLTEVLSREAGERYSDPMERDIQEIVNYRRALLMAEEALQERPVSLQLIRGLHEILMKGVRGGDKTPGSFRRTQNWIGRRGTSIGQARFVPPEPAIMNDALRNLEEYIASEEAEPLVQLAVVHAQFEIIHPFKDGNGRLGRMLIPLLLFQRGVLRRPVFYLSEYLEEVDVAYRDRLLAITENGDWQGWVEFFLEALYRQAERNTEKARRILRFYEEMKPRFADITGSQYAMAALDALFARPIINSAEFMNMTAIGNRGTAGRLLRALGSAGVLQVLRTPSGRLPAIYAFPALIDIAEGLDEGRET